MSERRESSCSESIELVSEDLDLLCLLLGDVEKLAFVGDLLDLLAWVSIAVVHGVGLQAHDLLSLIDVVLELTRLRLELLALHSLFSDFSLELQFGVVDGLDSLLSIFFKLFDLVLKSLLVFFILLLVLSLDDFLSLLGHTIELDVLCSLLEISDFQIKSLFLIPDPLETGLEVTNLIHLQNFVLTSAMDLFVLEVDHVFSDQNGILVVSGYWKLRNLDLSLPQVDNGFKIESDLLDSVSCLLLGNNLPFMLLFYLTILLFQIVDVLLQLSNLVLELFFVFVHFSSAISFLYKSLKGFFR